MSDATEAFLEWRRDYGHGHRQYTHQPSFEAGFAAGQIAALEDAANDLDGSDKAKVSYHCIAADLRARAAELSKETP